MTKAVLDPELVLGLCRKFRGYDGVVRYLDEQGVRNPKTKRPYTKHAVRHASMQAPGYAAWRRERDGERADAARDFRAAARRATQQRKGGAP